MKLFTPEQIKQANEIDILTYLMNYEPQELVKVGINNYTTKTHDSLKISNGMWYWFYGVDVHCRPFVCRIGSRGLSSA